MATYTEVWKCCECEEIHDDEDGAEDCCKPRIEELYRCDLCDEVHEGEDEAAECCGDSAEDGSLINCPACRRDYRSNEIAAQAVEVSGHCQTCNPLFTIHQQHQIEDLHFDRTGVQCDLARGE